MDEYSVQSLGFINRLKKRLSQIDQRTAFDAFIIILILIGLAASVFLAGQRQIFRSRAAQNGSAEVVDEQGNAMPKEGENFIVETQQIRLKIDFPTEWNSQSFVPSSLFSPAYAQQISCGTPWTDYSGQIRTTVCSEKSQESEMPGCIYLSNYKCSDQSLPNCWACPSQQTTAPTSTPTPTQPPAQTATCIGSRYKCASPRDQTSALAEDGSICTSYLGNSSYNTSCVARGTGYNWCYTSCAQAPTATPIPTRPPAAAQPTATPTPTQPPQRATQPPTATPIPEQTQWIRISLSENNVKSGNCFREPGGPGTGSSNPREHCMEFSITDPYFTQRGNIADLWLPNETGTYTIYI